MRIRRKMFWWSKSAFKNFDLFILSAPKQKEVELEDLSRMQPFPVAVTGNPKKSSIVA